MLENSTKLHTKLVAAIEAGDAEAAERIRKNSLLGQIQRFSDTFKKGKESS